MGSGLQIRQLGLQSWIVPTSAYEQHWVAASLPGVKSAYGTDESARRSCNATGPVPRQVAQGGHLPEKRLAELWSGLRPTMLQQAKPNHARAVIQSLAISYPDIPEVQALASAWPCRTTI